MEMLQKNLLKIKFKKELKSSRCSKSPNADPKPGPTQEHPDNPHQLSAADVKLEDKYNEKIVVMNPDDPVESATKAIQTEVDNLTAKADKFLGSRKIILMLYLVLLVKRIWIKKLERLQRK